MKTKKQVMDDFARLSKRYLDVIGFVTIKEYQSESGHWSVGLDVTAFEGNDIVWSDSVTWEHYSHQDVQNEAKNEQSIEEFVKRMEGRKNG